ncbi:MAG: tryptophan--tRNA ligase [Flavobacteriales bacterium]|nr:tryptophan--tRNA ligase [Flavobacteriales bacterium]
MRILTGIQSTGVPHLGNLLGAILPAISMSRAGNNDAFLFIADLHSFTTVRDPQLRKENTYAVAAAWLACGLDVERVTFYRQSDVPEVTELTWYLQCMTPCPMLENAHSFKDALAKGTVPNAGVFNYPVLMAADILLYDTNVVPVGKDQKQHLEITRDIASVFNRAYGEDTFVMPEARIDAGLMTIPGTDGRKMSKSYNNTINVFLPEKELKKQVMGIVTDSKSLEEPKDPATDNVFQLFKLAAPPEAATAMEASYRAGGYGYGHAKKELLEVLLSRFAQERATFQGLMADRSVLDKQLAVGAEKARAVAQATLQRVRGRAGYGTGMPPAGPVVR